MFPGASCAAQPEVTLPHGDAVPTYKVRGWVVVADMESGASFFRDKSGTQQGDVRNVLRAKPRLGEVACGSCC